MGYKAEDRADQHRARLTEAPHRKLSKEDAVFIFYDTRSTYAALARRFGVAWANIKRIKNGEHLYSPLLYQDDLFERLQAAFEEYGLVFIMQEFAEAKGVFGKKKPVKLSAFAGHLVSGRWRLEPMGEYTFAPIDLAEEEV